VTVGDTVLVTGGAGYIGSHTVRRLIAEGQRVVVLDDFSTGQRWAVPPDAVVVAGDAGNQALVGVLIEQHAIGAVVHFAGSIVVPESVSDPLKYYRNNVAASRNLIEVCLHKRVEKFVFSSSAAVYGIPNRQPVPESARLRPINPYGTTKLITELMLRDVVASLEQRGAVKDASFRYAALRYFNVAGASLDGTLGQATPAATHLIKVACEAACGVRDKVTVFGTDYSTPDGTCIRDYIHVEDLARAHLDALAYLDGSGASDTFNCGYGRGVSVRQVLHAVQKAAGVEFPVQDGPRRPGDPPELVAESSRIRKVLGWKPKHDDLEVICETAFRWETRLNKAYSRA
jgi:UDP-glucose 4-epimerase